MMKKKLDLIFSEQLILRPIIYELSQNFSVVFNIRRARVIDQMGEMLLEIEGAEVELNRVIAWLNKEGVQVKPIVHDILSG